MGLVERLVKYCPAQLPTLPDRLQQALSQSLLFGLDQAAAVAERCLEAIRHLGRTASTPGAMADSLAHGLMHHLMHKHTDAQLVPLAALCALSLWTQCASALAAVASAAACPQQAAEVHALALQLRACETPADGEVLRFQVAFARFVRQARATGVAAV